MEVVSTLEIRKKTGTCNGLIRMPNRRSVAAIVEGLVMLIKAPEVRTNMISSIESVPIRLTYLTCRCTASRRFLGVGWKCDAGYFRLTSLLCLGMVNSSLLTRLNCVALEAGVGAVVEWSTVRKMALG